MRVTICCLIAFFMAFTFAIGAGRIARRRKERAEQSPPTPQPTFDLVELQGMLDSGKITPEEYERLRVVVMNQRRDLPDSTQGSGFQVLPNK